LQPPARNSRTPEDLEEVTMDTKDKHDYAINLDIKHGPLELIDVPGAVSRVDEDWFNQTLCRVNDCVVRLGVFRPGEFHWHKHDEEDEFFFVLEGNFSIETEDGAVTLGPHQGYTVPRGVRHRTWAGHEESSESGGRTVILMVEAASVSPTGD
jgi:quercetin dioxygenase-like cupin family protein